MVKIFQPLALLAGMLTLSGAAPVLADRAPDWLSGSYEGYNRKYHQTIDIRPKSDGCLLVTNYCDGKEVACNTGYYHRGVLTIDSNDYRVSRNVEGFCMTQVADSSNRVDFHCVGNSDSYGRSDTSWRNAESGWRNRERGNSYRYRDR